MSRWSCIHLENDVRIVHSIAGILFGAYGHVGLTIPEPSAYKDEEIE